MAKKRFAPLCVRVLGAMMLLSSQACYDVGTVAGAKQCTPGEHNCVCDLAQSCNLGLVCRLDRCLEPLGDAGQTSTMPGASGATSGAWPDQGTASNSTGNGSVDPTNEQPGPSCEDGVQNGQETDLDCGGGQCIPCVIGQHCLQARDCRSQECVAGVCQGQDPECVVDAQCNDANSCTLDRCVSNRCEHPAAPDGTACDDRSACTLSDLCRAGECQGEDAILLEENFDRSQGFGEWSFEHYSAESSLRSTWEIGRAKASECGDDGGFGEDPGADHSDGRRNRVLGSDIGGCHNHGFAPAWDCAWTPYVDMSKITVDMELSFWRHLHAPGYTSGGAKGTGVRHKVAYRLRGEDGDKVVAQMESASGYDDPDWTRQSYLLPYPPKGGPQEVSVGFCYQRSGRVLSFAGWSVDDVLIRPKGCKPGL